MKFEIIGDFALSLESVRTVIRVDYNAKELGGEPTESDIKDYLSSVNISVDHLGIEGCPGRWYTSRVRVVYHDKTYDYFYVEVTRTLDV